MNDRQYLRGQTVHDAVPFARELIEVAPERVLWGADFPHPNVKWILNDGDLVDLFAPFGDDVLRRRILVDNPNRRYWSDEKRA